MRILAGTSAHCAVADNRTGRRGALPPAGGLAADAALPDGHTGTRPDQCRCLVFND